jgi:hypothetical protein
MADNGGVKSAYTAFSNLNVKSLQTDNDKRQVMAIAHVALGKVS